MTIHTELTKLFELDYPIVLAPMGAVSGGELASAVANAGGLGLVGGGYGDPAWLAHELERVTFSTIRQWGVGLITWKATDEVVALALSYKPKVFFLSFGDPAPFAPRIKAAGCALMCQIQDLEGARRARDVGADIIVAQGAEAGGHGASRATLPLVPAVIDAVAPLPVLAAGGIADGRGLAAMLALGAAGVVIGTRFCAAAEALVHPAAQARLLQASGKDTIRTRVFDIVRGYDWPPPFTGRALRNRFVHDWHGKENALQDNQAAREAYRLAVQRGDFDTALVWAGEAADLISEIEPAAEIVRRIGADAAQQIRGLRNLLA